MTRSEFMILLTDAAASSVDFARRFVENRLPKAVRFHVLLNQSYDGNAEADERVYPEDDKREFHSITADAVADLLVRDERCPEWIDVAVEAEGNDYTLIRVLCCGRYTDDESRMYYTRQGTGPFGIKSPDLPFGYSEGTKIQMPKVQPVTPPNSRGLGRLLKWKNLFARGCR